MTPSASHESSQDDRVNQVIAEYLKSVEDGKPVDRQELLARHSDLAAELAAFFADRDRFEQAAQPLRAGVDMPTEASFAPRPTGPGTTVRYFGDYELLGGQRGQEHFSGTARRVLRTTCS
jgi:hypothetical protein